MNIFADLPKDIFENILWTNFVLFASHLQSITNLSMTCKSLKIKTESIKIKYRNLKKYRLNHDIMGIYRLDPRCLSTFIIEIPVEQSGFCNIVTVIVNPIHQNYLYVIFNMYKSCDAKAICRGLFLFSINSFSPFFIKEEDINTTKECLNKCFPNVTLL
jgi:hypothetical protein